MHLYCELQCAVKRPLRQSRFRLVVDVAGNHETAVDGKFPGSGIAEAVIPQTTEQCRPEGRDVG